MQKSYLVLLLLLLLGACQNPSKQAESVPKYGVEDGEVLRSCEKKLTDLIVIDIFSPPVASRVYVYPLIAAYEAAKYGEPGALSLSAKMNGFEDMPTPDPGLEYDYTIAAVQAFGEVAREVVFSKQEIIDYTQQQIIKLSGRNETEVNERSQTLGSSIATAVIAHLKQDAYLETRGMPRYDVVTQPGLWVPTLPDYEDATEPHWNKLACLVLDSASQFLPDPPLVYSEDKTSDYWKQLEDVRNAVLQLTPEQDSIAIFWDDNPFVSRTKGHLMFRDKKMTPGGHWLAIFRTIARKESLNLYHTARGYAGVATALYEAFISVFDAKYKYVTVRPETVINQFIDKEWRPWLVTPPFPSYTSGHSTISASAAEVLTSLVGDNYAFTDTTEVEYGLPVRSFASFRAAAQEASISRVYGGIHFRMDCDEGNRKGAEVGQWIVTKLFP